MLMAVPRKKIDEIDRKIIEALKKNARTPFTEIGKSLGLSDASIHFRVSKLRKAGIIKKYTIEVDEEAYQNHKVSGYMLIKVKRGKIEEVSKKLASLEDVKVVQEVRGSNDLIVKIEAASLEKLRNVVLTIEKNPSIIESGYLTVLKTWKDERSR
ncbi:Lrp/AsnC family transcriptional regulator [Candidatus Bathyarchaeota archaeon]|nr:Lrp/AsnC family transcriptional regulator [Candidatus Bathyarchaeota archaeon]PDM26884.1 MAG: hypothetical protein CP083_01495 [Candidatus Bathyarchaeota archaeon B24-2]RJS83266.1 MAG: Lrp/AsnC family transcriptional regulator [Candidatus Bathyarchaeota archaeon]RLG97924.1 MAG: hypothetical protein DRO28_03485 [Candidatus Bathyarchaeota archaeon]RLI22448.1 MAG: hypothetical protein DRO47_02585 [Candidatus Bathyarchaeota archaeon]